MATDLNRCEFIGRLGKNVELKTMKNGDQMAIFSIAVGESYLSKTGERVKKTEWINLVAYRKLAEICSKYLAKGSKVYVSGKMSTSKYVDKTGQERNSVQIILETMNMLDARKETTDIPSNETSSEVYTEEDIPF